MIKIKIVANNITTENGKILGKQGKMLAAGVQEVILLNGKETCAFYGTLDEKGEFHRYCTNSSFCNKCHATNSPSCRYNRNLQKNAGYYLDIAK